MQKKVNSAILAGAFLVLSAIPASAASTDNQQPYIERCAGDFSHVDVIDFEGGKSTQNNPAVTSVSSNPIPNDGKPFCTGNVVERVKVESAPSISSAGFETFDYYCSTGNSDESHYCYVEFLYEDQLVKVADQCPYKSGELPLNDEGKSKGVLNVPYLLDHEVIVYNK